MKTHKLKVNGVELYAEAHGNGEETLFLLHPGGTNLYIWHKIIPHFIDQYQVVTVDLRGHGQSEMAMDGYEMNNQARDLIGLMDALSIEKAHLVGNSLGTDVSVHLAASAPGRVCSLVNIDAGMLNFIGSGGEVEGTKEEWVNRRLSRENPSFKDRETFKAYLQENYAEWGEEYVRLTGERTPLRFLADGTCTHAMPNEAGARLMAAWCDMSFENCYPHIQCPVLFLPAEQEPRLQEKLAAVERYSSSLPHTECTVIPGTTHISLVTHHQEIAGRILDFLAPRQAK